MSNPTQTKISLAYAALVTLLKDTLPDHSRLQYADELDRNPETLLRNGWALQIGGGSRRDRCIQPQYSRVQQLTLTITKEILGKDSDTEAREQTKLWALEDLHLVISALVEDLTLGGNCQSIVYGEDQGPEVIEVGSKPYVALDVTLSMEIIQQVSGG